MIFLPGVYSLIIILSALVVAQGEGKTRESDTN